MFLSCNFMVYSNEYSWLGDRITGWHGAALGLSVKLVVRPKHADQNVLNRWEESVNIHHGPNTQLYTFELQTELQVMPRLFYSCWLFSHGPCLGVSFPVMRSVIHVFPFVWCWIFRLCTAHITVVLCSLMNLIWQASLSSTPMAALWFITRPLSAPLVAGTHSRGKPHSSQSLPQHSSSQPITSTPRSVGLFFFFKVNSCSAQCFFVMFSILRSLLNKMKCKDAYRSKLALFPRPGSHCVACPKM